MKTIHITPIFRGRRRAAAGLAVLALVLAGCVGFTPTVTPEPVESAASEAVTLPSGLIIEDLAVGSGAEAAENDEITVNYTGMLEDGSVFDSTQGRQPATFQLARGRLIDGWVDGIPGMRVGGVRRLTIPAALGYGERGYPPIIPGGATLIFEVELVGVAGK